MMQLKLLLPSEIIFEGNVQKIVAEAKNGFFCLLPRHIDFVAGLVPSILYVTTEAGTEHYFAINHGTLVKCGSNVRVSTFSTVYADDLETLKDTVAATYLALDERERAARSALARLEAGTIRRFMELKEQLHA